MRCRASSSDVHARRPRACGLVAAAASAWLGCAGGDADGDAVDSTGAVTMTTVGDPTTVATDMPGSSDETSSWPSDDDDDGPSPPDCVAPEVACGQTCADLQSDPSNCGECGRSCVVSHGTASCTAGVCGLGTCDAGWGDCDGDLGNGCEVPVECDASAACMTACGSTGVTVCDAACAPSCTPPAESCNAFDDNCDGVCDEGPIQGCRVGVHRAAGGLGHFYGTSVDEIVGAGMTMEAQDFFFVYPAAIDGLIPLFRCIKPNAGGRRFLTSSTDCEGTAAPELTLGYISPDEICGAIPLYRLYAPASDDHFYTTSAPERDNAIAMFGYQDQGSPGFVFTSY